MILFGSGKLIAVPTHDYAGVAIAVPQPVVLGLLQEVSLDLSVDIKTLYGADSYPVAVAQGKGKISVKAKNAEIDAGVMGSLFFGMTPAAAIKNVANDVPGTVPGTPYQLTPSVPGSGTWVADLGVFDAVTGAQLIRVASSPATGQYSVAAGVYTFAAADTTDTVKFNFEYSATSSAAKLFTITNRQMGYTPSFSMILKGSYDGHDLVAKFFRGVSSKLNFGMKNEDFTIPDFEAEAFANPAGDVGWICMV